MANWEKEQSDIETDTKLTPEEKEKAKIESTAKALEMVDKQNFEGFKKYRTINGLLYIHEKTSDPTLDYIRVYDKSKEVGHLFYGEEKQGDGFLKGGVQVDESLQRKGIASRMYEMAEQVSGMKFVPDTPHSKSAEKLWASSSRRFGKDKSGVTIEQSISEAYHKAKADGSNPELVKAVEDLLQGNKPTISKEQTEEATQEEIDATAKALEVVKEFKAESDRYFEYVPIEEIEKYKEFDRATEKKWGSVDNTLEELVADIQKNGIKTPITLQVDRNNNALLVEGNTRLAAAKKLGIKHIPVRVISGEFGSINKDKTKKLGRKRDIGEMNVFYPYVNILNQENSPAKFGFTSITNTKNISEAYHKAKADYKAAWGVGTGSNCKF